MISRFAQLKKEYGSKEITMDQLRTIGSIGIVSFTNEGISRSNKDCLICVITFDRLNSLIGEISGCSFPDKEVLSKHIEASIPGLLAEEDEGMVTYRDAAQIIEIISTVADDLSVTVKPEDIEAKSTFQVFLRVQH